MAVKNKFHPLSATLVVLNIISEYDVQLSLFITISHPVLTVRPTKDEPTVIVPVVMLLPVMVVI